MSDPRSSADKMSVGASDGESGPGQGEWAGTGGVGWGGRRGETLFCSCPAADMLSQLKDDELGGRF